MNAHKSTPQTSTEARTPGLSQPAQYQIVLAAYLDERWRDWFQGMEMTGDLGQRTTTLTGRIPDQAALHGYLAQIRDLGLPLISVNLVS